MEFHNKRKETKFSSLLTLLLLHRDNEKYLYNGKRDKYNSFSSLFIQEHPTWNFTTKGKRKFSSLLIFNAWETMKNVYNGRRENLILCSSLSIGTLNLEFHNKWKEKKKKKTTSLLTCNTWRQWEISMFKLYDRKRTRSFIDNTQRIVRFVGRKCYGREERRAIWLVCIVSMLCYWNSLMHGFFQETILKFVHSIDLWKRDKERW